MIKAVYVFKGRNGSSKDLADLLHIISGRTSYQAGCDSSKVWENKNTSEMMLVEEWDTIEDLMIHISSKLFKRLLNAMELCIEKPGVSYYECGSIRGMDLIEEVLLSRDRIFNQD